MLDTQGQKFKWLFLGRGRRIVGLSGRGKRLAGSWSIVSKVHSSIPTPGLIQGP